MAGNTLRHLLWARDDREPVHPHLQTRVEAIQQSLMAHYQGGGALPSASRGSEREAFVRNYLEALFPPSFRFGTGAVIDSMGAISGQLDVVIEQPFEPSFPMPGSKERLYFAESVAAVVEVKSNLAHQWSEVESTAEKLTPLVRDYGPFIGGFGAMPPPRIPFAVVGYDGPVKPETIESKIDALPARGDVCALVIKSGSFAAVGQSRITSHGVNGFLDFAGWIMDRLNANLHFTSPREKYRAGPQPEVGSYF